MKATTTTAAVRYRPDTATRRGGYVVSWQSPTMTAPAFEEFRNRYDAAQHVLALLFRTEPRAWRVECLTAPR